VRQRCPASLRAASAPTSCSATRRWRRQHVYAAGPVWLESWRGLDVEESYRFPGPGFEPERPDRDGLPEAQKADDLRRRLYRIGREYPRLPRALCQAARELASLLDRPEALRDRGFRVERDVEGGNMWVCVPLDYLSFAFVEGDHGREARRLDAESQPFWRDALLRIAAAEASILTWDPVVPRYDHLPFVSFQATGDPTGLERAFDGRYFMASTELNLLNTILFVG
jgi:hypothetical protein